jgi:hypothetical protein
MIDAEIARTQSARVGEDGTKPRTHLGASVIGRECLREIWLNWRWATRVQFEGRMLRLFDRGHEEEPRFVRWFERVGASIETVDPSSILELYWHPESDSYCIEPYDNPSEATVIQCDPVSGDPVHVARAAGQGVTLPDPRQHRFIGYMGHFGGSLDGIATGVPGLEPFGYNKNSRLLAEFKTHNLKSFTKLVSEGVEKAKPEHYAQMQIYGHEFQCDASIYAAVCKDNDHLHLELVPLDVSKYQEMLGRAKYIVDSRGMPPRMPYASPSNFKCQWCDQRLVCHFGVEMLRNCRTCVYSQPIDGANWHCNNYGKTIPKDFVVQGCGNWIQIPNG